MDQLSLGSEKHQRKILFHIFFSDFPKNLVKKIDSTHFTEEKHKVIYSVIKDYFNKYRDLPNLRNVGEIINKNKTVSKEQRNAWISELSIINKEHEKLLSGNIKNDFEYVKTTASDFIKVQELNSLATNDIRRIVESNDFRTLPNITSKIRDILLLDFAHKLPDDIEDFDETIYTNRYRGHIPTGLIEIDKIIIGLPKGKMGMFIAAQGVGKSTILINTSYNAFKAGFNVLHIIFTENTPADVQLLFSTAITGISLSDARKNPKAAHAKAKELLAKIKSEKHCIFKIKKFASNETTIEDIKSWVLDYQKETGIKFDQINLDYIDDVISERKGADEWSGQKDVASALLNLYDELDICGWSALQAKKEANSKKVLELNDGGGSVARIKKAQVVITIGRDSEDRNQNRATFHLAKSNISASGHIFQDAVFDTSRMRFELPPPSGGTIVEEFDDDSIEEVEYEDYIQQLPEKTMTIKEEIQENVKEIKNEDNLVDKLKSFL